jgi:hypothetical protein
MDFNMGENTNQRAKDFYEYIQKVIEHPMRKQ